MEKSEIEAMQALASDVTMFGEELTAARSLEAVKTIIGNLRQVLVVAALKLPLD